MTTDQRGHVSLRRSLMAALTFTVLVVGASGVAGAKVSAQSRTKAARLTVVPAGTCATTTARGGGNPVWVPTELGAVLTPAAAKALEFYSVGTESVLGPRGWDCGQVFYTDGSAQLAVYPPGTPNPVVVGSSQPAVGAQLVNATFDYTDHGPGYDLACTYFPHVTFGTGTCPSTVPTGEKVTQLTPDVASIIDPAGVKGALAGSGGPRAVTGLMIVPQAPNLPVDIAEVSCSLKAATLCPNILNDFVVRQFPRVTRPTS